ncbi:MAG: trypsin-like peptidase domain-containing protein [Bacteroidales bacterium]|nr:trypsin-like peptidase domain-containing protein [Bacteroidales bacterium]
MKKHLIFSLFAALLLLMQTQTFAQTNPVSVSENYYKGIVKILLFDPVLGQTDSETLGYLGRGTGFFVTSDGIIFTNKQVVDKCVNGYVMYKDTKGGKKVKTYKQGLEKDPSIDCVTYSGYSIPIIQVYHGRGPNDYKLYLGEVITLSDAYDGAVLRVVSDMDGKPVTTPFTALPIGNSDVSKQGEEFIAMGFQAKYDGNYDLALKDVVGFVKTRNNGLELAYNKNYGHIKLDQKVVEGTCGGPVFGKDNKVVGIAKATKTETGLMSGINGMYYVVAPTASVFKNLISKGLVPPANAENITVTTGDKKAMPIFTACDQESVKPSAKKTSITGIVKSADTGRPIKNAIIGLLIFDEVKNDFVIVSGGTSDAKGKFVLDPDVMLGQKYGVACMANGYKDLVDAIDLKESNKNMTITLAKSR